MQTHRLRRTELSTEYRASFIPACASFGPVFIVLGYALQGPLPFSPIFGYFGAAATSYALFTLYKIQIEAQQPAESSPVATPATNESPDNA